MPSVARPSPRGWASTRNAGCRPRTTWKRSPPPSTAIDAGNPHGAAAAPAIDTAATRRLWLAPDWHRPETWLGPLSAYLAHAPTDGSTCLALDATTAPVELVATLVGAACDRLAGDAPFGDVLIVDT